MLKLKQPLRIAAEKAVKAWEELSANMRDADEHLDGNGKVHKDFNNMDVAMDELEGTMK